MSKARKKERKDAPVPQVDFVVTDQGTVIGFQPLTDGARQWTDEHVHSEPWQWMGNILWVDHRMAGGLLDGIESEGFTHTLRAIASV